MKKILPAVLCVCAVACSSAELESVDTQSQPASFIYGALNGSTTISQLSTRFCHMTYAGATGGHAGASSWPNGVPKDGAFFGASPPSMTAMPYNTALGAALSYTKCDDFSNYGFGSKASQSPDGSPPYLLWGQASGQNWQYGTVPAWDWPSICWVNGITAFSNQYEMAKVYTSGSKWYLDVGGYPVVGAEAKCVYPDKAWTYHGTYYATAGQSILTGLSVNSALCVFSHIEGVADDGAAEWATVSGTWVMKNTGLTDVEGYCATF